MNANRNAGTSEFVIPAGGSIPLNQHAEFLVIADATGPFGLSIDEGGKFTGLSGGWRYLAPGVDGFHKARFFNEGASDVTVTVHYGWGEFDDNRLTVSGVIQSKEVAPDVFASLADVSAVDGAATQIFAADEKRMVAIVANKGTGMVYLCGAGAGVGEGVPLPAGDVREVSTSAALYARNDTGGPVDIGRAEVKRS